MRRVPPPPSRDNEEDDDREYEEEEEGFIRIDTSSTTRHDLDASIDSCQCHCESLELELEEPKPLAEPFPVINDPENDEEGSAIARTRILHPERSKRGKIVQFASELWVRSRGDEPE